MPSKIRFGCLAWLVAFGLIGWAVGEGLHSILAPDDSSARSVDPANASAEPDGRWMSITGLVDPESIVIEQGIFSSNGLVAFQLENSDPQLILVTSIKRTEALSHVTNRGWLLDALNHVNKTSPPPTAIDPTLIAFLTEPQTFEGLIVHPDRAFAHEGEAELEDERIDITGFMGVCRTLSLKCKDPAVLLVGETPESRIVRIVRFSAIGLAGLVAFAVGLAVMLSGIRQVASSVPASPPRPPDK